MNTEISRVEHFSKNSALVVMEDGIVFEFRGQEIYIWSSIDEMHLEKGLLNVYDIESLCYVYGDYHERD